MFKKQKSNKYIKSLYVQVEEDVKEEAEQIELRKKYWEQNIDPDKVIVEKSNMVKFFVNHGVSLVKTIAQILMIGLAAVGILALIYPVPRAEIFRVFEIIFIEVRMLVFR